MLSQRQKQHATPAEISAVRHACRKLITVRLSRAKVGSQLAGGRAGRGQCGGQSEWAGGLGQQSTVGRGKGGKGQGVRPRSIL